MVTFLCRRLPCPQPFAVHAWVGFLVTTPGGPNLLPQQPHLDQTQISVRLQMVLASSIHALYSTDTRRRRPRAWHASISAMSLVKTWILEERLRLQGTLPVLWGYPFTG
jgi:hypothetical protein